MEGPFQDRHHDGTANGQHLAIDECCHNPRHPDYQDEKRRAKEHETFEVGKRQWAKTRFGKPLAQTLAVGRVDAGFDRLEREYLQVKGLLTPDEATKG